jgi:hypothetical protein
MKNNIKDLVAMFELRNYVLTSLNNGKKKNYISKEANKILMDICEQLEQRALEQTIELDLDAVEEEFSQTWPHAFDSHADATDDVAQEDTQVNNMLEALTKYSKS